MCNRIAVTLAAALCLVELAEAQSPGPIPAESGGPLPPADSLPADPAPAILPDNSRVAPGSRDRCEMSADYLFGWIRSSLLPPVVTTSPAGTAQTSAGVLGQPGTTVLFGDSNAGGEVRSGFRVGLSGWLDRDYTLGIDTGFFMLESQNALFFANSPSGSPILARPFVDARSNTQASQLVAFPGLSTGSIVGSARSDNFYGAHIDFQEVEVADHGCRLIALLGYRFLRFSDRLAMDTNEVALGGGAIAAGTQIMTSDRFTAENIFHGGEVGVRTELFADKLSAGLVTKLAVGNLHRSIAIAGSTRTTVPGATAPVQSPGGFLALSSNSGVFGSNDWEVVPEVGVTAGWAVTPHLHLRLGYSWLYWPEVARASNQVDLNINPALFPPPQPGALPRSPSFQLRKSDLWVQTLNLGLELQF